MATELLIGIATALGVYLAIRWYKDPLRQIPGPPGLPLFGNALQMDQSYLHVQLHEWAKEYGPVMKIKIFTKPIVLVNSIKAINEALLTKGTDFNGRPFVPRVKAIVHTNVAFTNIEHPQFHTIRRTATKGLKSYGAGVAALEKVMLETTQDLVDILMQSEKDINCNQLAYGYVCCVISSVLFGEKYTFDDPICKSLHLMNTQFVKTANPAGAGALIDIYPALYHVPGLFSECHRIISEANKMAEEHVNKRLQEAKASYDPNQLRGCLDYFIKSSLEEVDKNGKPILDDECLMGLTLDFIIGGMETSTTSLTAMFITLLNNPNLIKRLQAQIDENFGPNDKIQMAHREKLPLLEAFLHENLRILSQLPLLVPHMTIKDTEVAGYKIPANTEVFINAFHAAHDTTVYENPFEFNIDRWLDEKGDLVAPDHPVRRGFVGFGAGRRQCPGELLARTRIFLLMASILQKFNIIPVGKIPEDDVRKFKMGILLEVPEVSARFVYRH